VDDADLHLASVTLGEIQAGIELTREQDPAKAAEIEQWLDQVSVTFNVLPMDGAVFRCWAQLMHRQSDTLDVVTRNVADFSRFDVPLLNPFSGAGELS
jgi:predicted nucleic acid-binding protein